MNKEWIKYILIAALGFYAVFSLNLFGILPGGDLLEQGKQAPDFALKDYQGNTIKLSDYREKVVLLTFWFPS